MNSPQQRQKTQNNETNLNQQSQSIRSKYSNSSKRRDVIPYQRGSQIFKQENIFDHQQIEKKQLIPRPRTRSNMQDKLPRDIIELPNQTDRIRSSIDIKNLNYAKRSQVGKKQNQQTKKQNQDTIIEYKQANFIIFGVCDGHGTYGHFVAEFVSQYLPKSIATQIDKNQFVLQCDMKFHYTIIKNAFLEAEDALRQSTINIQQSGTTATIAILVQQPKQNFLYGGAGGMDYQTVLFMGSVGDSRAILVRNSNKNKKCSISQIKLLAIKDIQVIALTQDHRPDDPIEKERILNRGGKIEPYRDYKGLSLGPQRIWLPDMTGPGLAMSRSLGDKQAHSLGVSSEPSITQYNLNSSDCFIIIGSDGIWQYLTNEEVANIVYEQYLENNIEQAANTLIEKATESWIQVKVLQIYQQE